MIIIIGLKVLGPVVLAGDPGRAEDLVAQQKLQALAPISVGMVEQALDVLGQGWDGMSDEEQALFLALYDPAGTGDVDAEFVQIVQNNFQQILAKLNQGVPVSYEKEHDLCTGQRLYYTDYLSLHICPFFFQEPDETRQARELVHEYAHIALRVKDRPYYRPTSRAFSELTPRGSWAAQLPVIGPLVREIVASDTLYHPDAYAHFALALSDRPAAKETYLNRGLNAPEPLVADGHDHLKSPVEVVDSWQR